MRENKYGEILLTMLCFVVGLVSFFMRTVVNSMALKIVWVVFGSISFIAGILIFAHLVKKVFFEK